MKRMLVVSMAILFTSQAYADLTYVADAKVIEHTHAIMGTVSDQLDKLKELKTVNEGIQKQLTGNFNYGAYNNDDKATTARKITPSSWDDALKSAGNNKIYNDAYGNYKKIYALNKSDEVAPTSSGSNLIKSHYERSQAVNRAALASSEASFNQINEHIETLHKMVQELDAHPEEKAASEINARLVAENAFIQLEMLRQQTIQNQLLAMQSQGEINGMSDQADFLK